jgi:MOSC domain-containing protein YiiM
MASRPSAPVSRPCIHAVFAGGPRTITDAGGTWVSSILRDPVSGPIEVGERGLAGDAVAQPYHGSPDAAVCAHLMDHYRYWNAHHGLHLTAGMVGENLTLDGIREDQVCAGDIVRIGTTLLQVSGPRIPCATLARRIGRADWVTLTLTENRTGFYLRVLEAGQLQAGDAWLLCERPAPEGTIPAINRCMFLDFDPEFARRMRQMEGLGEWWKQRAREKLI